MKLFLETEKNRQGENMTNDKVNGRRSSNGNIGSGLTTEEPRKEELSRSAPVLRMQIDLFDLGRKRAVEGRALEINDGGIASLEEHARAMARETYREAFDPSRFAHDRLREDEYKKFLRDRGDAETSAKFAAAAVREREEELAKFEPAPTHPESPRLLMCAVLVVIAITVAPTLHDFVFSTIEDDLMAWFLSLATGGFLGALISWGILGSISATGRRTGANWAGLVAGLTITLGLGVFRFSGVQNVGEALLAVALTLVEAGVIVLAEWVASGLRELYREFVTRQTARDEAAARLDAARAEQKRRQDALDEINRRIAEHISYVEERELRHLSVKQLEEVAVKAVRDGYSAGIAENRSRII